MKNTSAKISSTLVMTWLFTVIISELPMIIIKEIFKIKDVTWFNKIILLVIIGILFFTLICKQYRYLFTYVLFIAILKSLIFINQNLLTELFYNNHHFINYLTKMQLPRLIIAIIMIGFLWSIKKSRHEFYLRKGNINAIAQPVKFVIDKPTPWKKVGIQMSFWICGITLVFLLIAGVPSYKQLLNTIPLVPYVVILALMNSFSENIIYRISFLTLLKDIVSEKQALYLTTFVFAMGHYYGAPYGITGVLMAAFLGWFLGKSIIETKGIFWAWTIHFLQDLLIMLFLASGTITLGGA
ncbi:CPBP family intramembrane glutamic endopeptidase [Brassicibacter mesophilus]|uniref:CPBP family intramembrane glutamic endopeptidase n=1 Tax=Brassicibacter mesophilus TaxID=745119 RepID=UPI003D26397E